ncbi:MAG: DUF4349 domain-containing protein [Bacteroidota bacterium]
MNTKQLKSVVKKAVIGAMTVCVFACNSEAYKEDVAMEAVDVSEAFESTPIEKSFIDNTSQEGEPSAKEMYKDIKIIKSATAKYKVDDVKRATTAIKKIAMQYEAYISDLRFQNNLYQIENRFTVKVPQEHFDAMMDSIAGVVSFIEYENITTKDVTEEYLDLQSRLKTKLEVKARYEEVLRRNAKTVEDILLTEDKLRVIQEEIESAQGRLKYLTSKVAYSTIQIDLYETVEYIDEPISYTKSFGDKSRNGFSFGWNMVEAIVLFLIHVWPLLIGGVVLVVFLRKRMRK